MSPSSSRSPWSLAKKDDAPRGVRRLEDGTWGIRYVCALGHRHKQRVGHVKRDAIALHHAQRVKARTVPGWCPALEQAQASRAAEARQAAAITFATYANR